MKVVVHKWFNNPFPDICTYFTIFGKLCSMLSDYECTRDGNRLGGLKVRTATNVDLPDTQPAGFPEQPGCGE